jgi:hypothetical protein
MLTIDIDRVTTRYRLPPAATGERPRLQRVVDDALRRVLDQELEQYGVDPGAYICVDAVRTVVPVRLGQPDDTLADAVGQTIAEAIHDALADGSAAVVRFSSRAHLLTDAATSALAGDFSRSWAWTQAGVWRSDGTLRVDAAANHVLRMLANDAVYAAGVLGFLARAYPDRLRTLLSSATPRAWEMLSRAVLSAAQLEHRPHHAPAHTIRPEAADADEPALASPGAHVTALATRVAARSAIAREVFAQWALLADATRRSAVMLAILEAEPAAARHAVDVAGALAAIWNSPRSDDASPVDDRVVRAGVSGQEPPARIEEAPAGQAHSAREETREHHEGRRGSERAAVPPAADTPVDVRSRVSSRYGGVLYLVNLLREIGLPETIDADAQWASRGMRWVLHQLAMRLVNLEPDDPAALVFAGLQPDAPPPSATQDPATDPENGALDVMTRGIACALHDRLRRAPAADGEDVLALVRDVFDRPAEILAEPAWIEARFALDDVSIEVRRAGLDINPDWVPWLGIVLRFVYA